MKKILNYSMSAFILCLFNISIGQAMPSLFNVGVGSGAFPTAGLFTMNTGGPAASVQNTFFELYSNTNCTGVLVTSKVLGGQFPINDGQTISLNAKSLYQLGGINAAHVRCAKFSLRGSGRSANPSGVCPRFIETCSAITQTCVTNQSAEQVNYPVSGNPCQGF